MADLFKLEAVFAKKGDALLLHYGSTEAPRHILIDGGPRGVYRRYLKPRLTGLKEELGIGRDEPLPLELVIVSHIDDDHIAGIIDIFREQDTARTQQQPKPYAIEGLWHNTFDDLLGEVESDVASRIGGAAESGASATVAGLGIPLPTMEQESEAVLASTRQGRTLRDLAKALAVRVNHPFNDLVCSPAPDPVDCGGGLTLRVLGPDQARIEKFRERWTRDLVKILREQGEDGQVASFEDDSPFNLASIVALAELNGKRMLLTGDARGDFVLDWLNAAGLLRELPLHVDLLKLPHHGSDRNVDPVFFETITADHYVVSGDGEHHNPEVCTLEMLAASRGTDEYAIHFTVTEDQHLSEQNQKRREALEAVAEWTSDSPPGCKIHFRESGALSTTVALIS